MHYAFVANLVMSFWCGGSFELESSISFANHIFNRFGHFLVTFSRGFTKGWFSKRVVLADVPPQRTPENEGTKTRTRVRSPVLPERKTGTRVYSRKPPFYETAPLSPLDISPCPSFPCFFVVARKATKKKKRIF